MKPGEPGTRLRLVPDIRRIFHSLAGQLLVLLLMALALAHLLAVLAMSWGERTRVHPLAARTITTQVMTAYRLALAGTNGMDVVDAAGAVHVADAADATDMALRALSVPESRFARGSRPPAQALDAQHQEPALIDAIRQGLRLPDDVPVYAALRQIDTKGAGIEPDAPAWLIQALEADQAWALDIALPLPGGQWLHSQHWPVMMHPHWGLVLRFSFGVSVLASMLIAVLFGRSVMRPLKALAHAARRISRGETLPPLPLQGPRGVREITRAFNDMQQRLSRYVTDRTRMLAAIGHDLRTPLTALRIRAEMIQDQDERQAMCATLDEMSAMIGETLSFARDDDVSATTQPVDLAALIGEVAAHQRVLGHDVSCATGPAIVYPCRPLHIKRVLNNLIENAARYGRVAVQVIEQARQLHITVQDDGPGIAPDQLERVFEPFTRLDAARNLESGGAGLGLAIARSFARAHGGDIRLHNRAQGGLCAVVTLPR